MNIENIKKTQEALARLMFTQHYDMGEWIGQDDCGTTLCLAGIASALSFESNSLLPSPNNLHNNFRKKLLPAIHHTHNRIKHRALDFFGIDESDYPCLSPDEPDNIFFYTEWPEGLQVIYDFDVPDTIAELGKGFLYYFVLAHPDLPDSFFKTLAGYLGLECLIERGPLWTQPARHWQAADFVSYYPGAVSRFISIAEELLGKTNEQ
jgi:hypothetical protein